MLASQDSQIFAAIGGLEGVFATTADAVEFYDPESDRWRTGPPLPEPTSAAAVGVVDG